jgi:hypothetical protein
MNLKKRLMQCCGAEMGSGLICHEGMKCLNCFDKVSAIIEIERLHKLVEEAFCEGFYEGRNGGWIIGPSGDPWEKSDVKSLLNGDNY